MSQWVPADFPVQQLEGYVCRMFYSTSLLFAFIRAVLLFSVYMRDLTQDRLMIFFHVLNFAICIVGLSTIHLSSRYRFFIKLLYSESLNLYFLYQAFWLIPEYKLELTVSAFAVIGSFYQIAFNEGIRVSVMLTLKQLFMWISMDIMGSQSMIEQKFCTFMAVLYIFGAYTMLFYIYSILSRTRTSLVDQITEKTKQLAAVLESIQDGMVVLRGREVVMYNRSVQRIFSCRSSESVLQSLCSLTGLLPVVDDFVKAQSELYRHFGVISFDGRQYEWLGSKAVWDGQTAVILTCRDVSELIRLQDLANRENERKLALLRSISHELRTPMNYVKGMAEEITETPDSCDPEAMEVMLSCCNLMDLLVDELQDFAQVTSDTFELRDETVNLSGLLHRCVGMVMPYAKRKGLALNLSFDPELPSSINTDGSRLSQLLINLLSNAIKYTRIGSVRLVALVGCSEKVKLIVEDTGIGIDQQRLPRLFDGSSTKALPTSGLGLFMANQLAIMLGGDPLSVFSKVNVGSSFSFSVRKTPSRFGMMRSLSLTIPSENEEEDETHNVMPIFTTGHFLSEHYSAPVPEILIVDDYPFNRMVLRSILEKEGLFTLEAENGTEAISLVLKFKGRGRHFRLIMMDFDMPIMDGITTTRELRRMQEEDAELVIPPIIGHSAYTSDQDRRKCLEAGMVAFLPKPCNKAEALTLINKIILPRAGE